MSDSLPKKVDTRIDLQGRHFSVPVLLGVRLNIGSSSCENIEHGEVY